MRTRETRIRPIEGSGHLVLRETGDLVEIVAGNVVLLSSAALATEFAFGRLAGTVGGGGRPSPRHILIGGLGFGATLRGVLDVAPADARVVVVEKVRAIPGLVRGPLAHIGANPLDDARVELVEGDVGAVVASTAGVDVILMDVDNGPHWASFRSNARFYTPAGLASFKRALAPGGALAVWSGYRADAFVHRLREAGFASSIVPLEERGRVRARAYVGRVE
jgi:spermidine synthase